MKPDDTGDLRQVGLHSRAEPQDFQASESKRLPLKGSRSLVPNEFTTVPKPLSMTVVSSDVCSWKQVTLIQLWSLVSSLQPKS